MELGTNLVPGGYHRGRAQLGIYVSIVERSITRRARQDPMAEYLLVRPNHRRGKYAESRSKGIAGVYILTRGFSLRRRDRGCPIPPAAPRTVTFDSYNAISQLAMEVNTPASGWCCPGQLLLTSLAAAEKALVWKAPLTALRAANMMGK